MAENKTTVTDQPVEAFVGGLASDLRQNEAQEIIAIMRRVSGEAPRMWGPSIIGFGSRAYRTDSGRSGTTPMIAFSPRKAQLVFYFGSGIGAVEPLLAKLGRHSVGKGCLYAKRLSDLDGAVLAEIIAAEWAFAQQTVATAAAPKAGTRKGAAGR